MEKSGISFITAVANDIYEKVNGVIESFEKVGEILPNIMQEINDNMTALSSSIGQMIEETNQNRNLTKDMFSELTEKVINQIQQIQDKKEAELDEKGLKETVQVLQNVSKNLNDKVFDIQYALIIAGIHTIVDVLKGLIQAQPTQQVQPASEESIVFSDKAPIPVSASETGKLAPKKPAKRKKGRRAPGKPTQKTVGSHEDELEKMRRKKRLFGNY
ncbi:MAG: hypothetical protein ACTSRW_05115 [Candidatus Helarchaeota archaeon]